MTSEPWVLTQTDGDLLIRTDVTGRAARLGHRLTIRMTTWQTTVRWADGQPVSVAAHIDAAGLEILSGSGGVKPVSGPEKIVARSNALGALHVDDHPTITFSADDVTRSADGYDLSGTLEINGVDRPHVVPLRVAETADGWDLSFDSLVTQTDFGITPYSLMLGAMRVGDEVVVSLTAHRSRS